MPTIRKFEEIEAWKTARELTKLIYKFTEGQEFSQDFGLRDQIRRAAVSIMSNIAEGFESHTQALFIKYLGQAKASAGEVRSQLYVASDLGYISVDEFDQALDLSEKTSGQIYRFISYLKDQPNTRRISDDSVVYHLPKNL